MHNNSTNEPTPTQTLISGHQSEESTFNEEVIQDDHELYYIHHYLDSMSLGSEDSD